MEIPLTAWHSPGLEGDVWAVLVFDGITVEFPPELHTTRYSAVDAAERWACILSMSGEIPVRRQGKGRWISGFRQVIMSDVIRRGRVPSDPWIGLTWEEGISPDPTIQMLDGIREAAAWVGSTVGLGELRLSPWEVSAEPINRTSSRQAAASKAKVVARLRQT